MTDRPTLRELLAKLSTRPAVRRDPSPAQQRAARLFADVSSRTSVLTAPADVAAARPGLARRRDRRPALVAAAKYARRSA